MVAFSVLVQPEMRHICHRNISYIFASEELTSFSLVSHLNNEMIVWQKVKFWGTWILIFVSGSMSFIHFDTLCRLNLCDSGWWKCRCNTQYDNTNMIRPISAYSIPDYVIWEGVRSGSSFSPERGQNFWRLYFNPWHQCLITRVFLGPIAFRKCITLICVKGI